MVQLFIGSCTGKLRVLSLSFVLLFLCGSFSLHSVQAAGLKDIYQQAQENDPTFQSASFQKKVIEEGRKQAIANYLPTLAASADYTDTSQDIISSDNEVFGSGQSDFTTTAYKVTLTQPIFRWDSIVGLKQSKAENLRAAAEYALAEQSLILRVADLYLQALAAQDLVNLAMAELASTEKLFELVSNRLEMGLVPITDMYDAKARLAATQAKTIEAQNHLDDALQALEEVTSKPVNKLAPLQKEISLAEPAPVDLDLWIGQALEQNTAIERQKHEVEVAHQEVRRQQSGHYPTLDVVGRFHDVDTDGTLFGGGSEVQTTDIMLQLNVPLYQGGYVNSRVREAKYQLGSARQELTKQRRFVRRQARSAYLGVNSDLTRIDSFHQSVLSYQLALEAKQEGFKSGLYTSMTVLDAERDLTLVSLEHAQARYDYIFNSLKLKQAVGTLNSQDIIALDQWFIE